MHDDNRLLYTIIYRMDMEENYIPKSMRLLQKQVCSAANKGNTKAILQTYISFNFTGQHSI